MSRVEKVSASGGEEESRAARQQLCAVSDEYEEDGDIVVVKRESGLRGSDKRWVYAGDGRATI